MPVLENAAWNSITKKRVRYSWRLVIIGLASYFYFGLSPNPIQSNLGAIGSFFIVFGLLFRSWSAGVVQKDRALATTGPYALTRHPLYTGSFLALIGLMLILNGWLLALCSTAIFAALYVPTLLNEEEVLAVEFSADWSQYKQSTAMFWPKQFSWHRITAAKWQFKQWLYNREYYITGLVSALAISLLIWAHLAA